MLFETYKMVEKYNRSLHFDIKGKTKKELIKMIKDFEDLRNEFVSKLNDESVGMSKT